MQQALLTSFLPAISVDVSFLFLERKRQLRGSTVNIGHFRCFLLSVLLNVMVASYPIPHFFSSDTCWHLQAREEVGQGRQIVLSIAVM